MSLIGEKICYTVSHLLISKNMGRYRDSSRISSNVKDFDNWRNGILQKSLKHFPNVSLKGKTVLDFGCGAGHLSFFIKDLGALKVYGVDLDSEAICRAKDENPYGLPVEFVIGTASSTPLPSNSIDLIFCVSVLEHVMEVDAILQEWYRILRPGGQVLIEWSAWHHPDSSHLGTVIPIPYAQCLFSERTLARTASRIKLSSAYQARFWDYDPKTGMRKEIHIQDAYTRNFLNKMSIESFNEKLNTSGLFQISHFYCHPPSWFPLIRPLLKIPFFGEHLSSFVTYVLTRPL